MYGIRYYLPGIGFILVAIMIVAVPEILIAIVAATLIAAGIGLLYIGHILRKSETGLRNFSGWISDEDVLGRRLMRYPVFRNMNRWF